MNTVNDIDGALRCIPADDRDVWVRMGMAIKSELGDSGYSLWDHWSQSAASYRERDAQAVWRSFKNGRITIGSLYYLAQQHGYRTDRKAPARVVPGKKPPPPQKSTNRFATHIWKCADCSDDAIRSHPYAISKGIDWAAGAGRALVSGRVVGEDADCIVVPIRSLATDKVRGVQVINDRGDKQTFGTVSGNGLVLGNTLDKSLYWCVCEGWASAVSMVFHHLKGNGVAAATFGKGNLDAVAHKMADVFAPEAIRILREHDD